MPQVRPEFRVMPSALQYTPRDTGRVEGESNAMITTSLPPKGEGGGTISVRYNLPGTKSAIYSR